MAFGLLAGIGSILSGVAGLAGVGVQIKQMQDQKDSNKDNLKLAQETLKMEQDRQAKTNAENESALQSSLASANKAQKGNIASIPSLTSDALPMDRD